MFLRRQSGGSSSFFINLTEFLYEDVIRFSREGVELQNREGELENKFPLAPS